MLMNASDSGTIYTLEDKELGFLQELSEVLTEVERVGDASRMQRAFYGFIMQPTAIAVINLFYKVERRKEEKAKIILPKEYEVCRTWFTPYLYRHYGYALRASNDNWGVIIGMKIPWDWSFELLRETANHDFYPNGAILRKGESFPILGRYTDFWYEDDSSPGIPVDLDDPLDNQVLHQKGEGYPWNSKIPLA